MVVDSTNKAIDASVTKRINSLNTEEIIKDIMKGWYYIHRHCTIQPEKFEPEKHKSILTRLAQELYHKYRKGQVTSQSKLVWDKQIFKDFYSIHIYQHETYPLFTYPAGFLVVEALDSELFFDILHQWFDTYRDLDAFAHILWERVRATRVEFSKTDLKLLKAFFSFCQSDKAKSCINFPQITEFWHKDLGFSKSTAGKRFSRLYSMGIVRKRTVINYARLGLYPLLKVYNEDDEPSETEVLFSNWESRLPTDKSLRLLVIPERSSFWYNHAAQDVYLLQSRSDGLRLDFLKPQGGPARLIQNIEDPTVPILAPIWQIHYETENFGFRSLDLRLLGNLRLLERREITPLTSQTERSRGTIVRRLRTLRKANVFFTQFQLMYTGYNERQYVFAQVEGKKEQDLVERFIRQFPRYYYVNAEKCIFALVWLAPEMRETFWGGCTFLTRKLGLEPEELLYGQVDQYARVHWPDLSKLWNEEKQHWVSEAE